MEDKKRLMILYATETGNALDAAERVGREADRRCCPAVVLSVDEYDANRLPDQGIVIFIVSTTGQGDTPTSMRPFWRFLLKKNLSPQWLERVHYAVFGLGDSGYQKFNVVAKKLDKRLSDLGGMQIIGRGLGDEQHPSGYEGALDDWLLSLWRGMGIGDPGIRTSDLPKFQVIYHDADSIEAQPSSTSGSESLDMQIERARLISPGKFSHERCRPHCFLQMVKNEYLTKEGCGKDVRHFEFEILSQEIRYQVGDVLEILPSQDPEAVDAFIKRCDLNPDLYITVRSKSTENGFLPHNSLKGTVKLKTFVELTMDVASASPRRYFFEVMSFFATAEHEKEKLQHFASPEGRDDLYQYNQKERRTVLEVLQDFPSVQMPFEWLVQLVPPLRTRAFSISSSLSTHPNQVHLAVSVVSWTTPFKRKRSGLCSKWLAGLSPQERVRIPVWFKGGCLPSPPPSLPLILIGPGTGCAPFRGFIEERALQSTSSPTAPVVFFFGCRNESDFLYKNFWLSHAQDNGVLSEEKGGGFFVAFSRNQPKKVYVQHKMEEERQRVWSLLSAGGAVYVAGSSTKMPADVLSCIETIVSKESGCSKESAVRWVRAVERAGKYHVEAWS